MRSKLIHLINENLFLAAHVNPPFNKNNFIKPLNAIYYKFQKDVINGKVHFI
jgi:hypothetical protein